MYSLNVSKGLKSFSVSFLGSEKSNTSFMILELGVQFKVLEGYLNKSLKPENMYITSYNPTLRRQNLKRKDYDLLTIKKSKF